MNIKVCVIVPIYNVEKYIERCLMSLANQTLKNIKIILVDDGSTDSSGRIAEKYADKYNNMIYLNKKNGGLSDARNFGLRHAEGEYIGFVDSDDYVEPDMFEKMYDLSNNGEKKIIECNFIWEYPNKKKNDLIHSYTSKKDYLINGRVEAWNKIYKLSWLRKSRIIFPTGLLYEDLNFFFKLIPYLENIDDIAIAKDYLIHYVQNDNTITNSETIKISHIVPIYEDIFNFYKELNVYNKYYYELEYKFCRNLLVSFMIKVLTVKDKKIRSQLLDLFIHKIRIYFPNWKKNVYMEKISLINIYLKLMNPLLYKLFYII
ncbi:glycosyltransferase [Lactiplantibacillus plantarum]|uniref:glycosyltransferase family 2 protein n=1 Tax=Lactiplantibacillus plantarum TaxID=1590 RepID=UPI0023E00DBA|nr:glycosyltransferase [Lactiplantibacillus plantarum]MDF3265839.1 glycosyltransferase [Lactiplantibacillus plantarum]